MRGAESFDERWPIGVRRRALPCAPVRGSFLICNAAWGAAERLLGTYRDPDGDHEGIVFALGRPAGADTHLITTVVAPAAATAPGRVHCDERQMLAVTRACRAHGLIVIAQVHSHPGSSTVHSVGDDMMVFLPREDLLSIVVPHYAHRGARPISTLGVHQFQDARWVRCDADSVAETIRLIPDTIDLR
ncbi:MAG: Mov34/MPN/PAD-1 family protein [Solirubrobacteraceae bacterium]